MKIFRLGIIHCRRGIYVIWDVGGILQGWSDFVEGKSTLQNSWGGHWFDLMYHILLEGV